MTFFEVQRRQRRRTRWLIGVELLLVWGLGNLLVLPAHLGRSCDPLGDCDLVLRPDARTAAIVAMLSVGLLAAAVLYAGWRSLEPFVAARLAAIATPLEHVGSVDQRGLERLRRAADSMAIAAGVPAPVLYVIDDAALNAFAVAGRRQGAIVVTTGLLLALDEPELTGVIAHETAHLRNRDSTVVWTATFAVGLVVAAAALAMMFADRGHHRAPPTNPDTGRPRNAVSMDELDQEDRERSGWRLVAHALAMVLWVLVRPTAMLVRAAISRRREQLADASAVQFTRDPSGLRRALERIAASGVAVDELSVLNASLWIGAPSGARPGEPRGLGDWWARLLDVHPPIEQRIAWLRSLEHANTLWLALPREGDDELTLTG